MSSFPIEFVTLRVGESWFSSGGLLGNGGTLPTHTASDTYEVALTVTDGTGNTDSLSVWVLIPGGIVTQSATFDPNRVVSGHSTTITASGA